MTAAWWTRRDPAELCVQRVALALLVYASFRALPRFSAQPFPVGIANWVDFTFLANPRAALWAEVGLLVALGCYVVGRAMPLAVAVMTALYTGAGALAYSQGALQHHTQLLALVLLAQLVAYVQATVTARPPRMGHALATQYSLEVIAASYVLSGLMKIVLSGGRWLEQVPMVAIDIAKAHGQLSCTTGEPGLVARADAIGAAIVASPNLTRTLFAPAVLFELAAGTAVFGRTLAAIVGLCLVGLHRSIDVIMAIRFWENEALLVIYFVNVPYLLVRTARAAMRWRRG